MAILTIRICDIMLRSVCEYHVWHGAPEPTLVAQGSFLIGADAFRYVFSVSLFFSFCRRCVKVGDKLYLRRSISISITVYWETFVNLVKVRICLFLRTFGHLSARVCVIKIIDNLYSEVGFRYHHKNFALLLRRIDKIMAPSLLFMALLLLCPIFIVAKDVDIMNGIQDAPILLHCRSKNSDLLERELPPDGVYSFSFTPNVFGMTLFWCSFEWNGREQEVEVWKGSYYSNRLPCCVKGPCAYKVMESGIYWAFEGPTKAINSWTFLKGWNYWLSGKPLQ